MERWLLDCFMARMMLLLMVVVGLGGVAGMFVFKFKLFIL